MKLVNLIRRSQKKMLCLTSNVLLWTFFVLFISPVVLLPVLIVWFKIDEALRRDVAAEIVAHAEKNGGVVEMTIFGDRVCVLPEGVISTRSYAEDLFPGREVTYIQTDESNGYWYVIFPQIGSEAGVEIYGISLSDIHWEHDKTSAWNKQIHCPNFMRFTQVDGIWTYQP